jgi:hypothetical protein
VPLACSFATISGEPAWLLDFTIRSIGTVVQQRIWAPHNEVKRHIHGPLNMPIFFVLKDSVTVGLPILNAAARDIMTLRGAGTPAPVGEGSSTLIRINVSANFPWLPCQCGVHTLRPEVELNVMYPSGPVTTNGADKSP